MRDKVLLVDDDPNILSAYTRNLRKRFQIDTAPGGAEALELMRTSGPYAVILSDMRMPGMDGIQFLSMARTLAPDTVRIMLTGNADQQTAIEAVNRGRIFRFLTKPCDADDLALTLESAIKQYQLVAAEHELVEGTLKGSIALLVELLSIADPEAFSRAQQLAPLAQRMARVLNHPSPWIVNVACLLSRIGLLTLPPGVLARVRQGEATPQEVEAIERLPEISSNLLLHIPRMEGVAQAILYMTKEYGGAGFPEDAIREDALPLAARILKAGSDFLDLRASGHTPGAALERLREGAGVHDPRVLEALGTALLMPEDGAPVAGDAPHLATHETVQAGQTLVEGVQTREGILLYPPQTRLGPTHLERLKNFAHLVGLKEPFLVLGGPPEVPVA